MLRTLGIVASCLLAGCSTPSGFGCSDDAQCGEGGVCAAPGYCAFVDLACDSGLVFGAHAGGLAGECVPDAGGSGDDGAGDEPSGGGNASDSGSGGPGSTLGSSTSPGDATVALDDGTSGGASSDPSASASASTSATDGSDTDATTDGSTTGPSLVVVSYPAALALCAYPDNVDPAPALCESVAGTDAFTVDLVESSSGLGAALGYLAFPIGPEPADSSVLAVTLHVHTTDGTTAETDQGGEVWLVEAFDEASLAVATPAPIGAAPIAAAIGAVGASDEAIWPLPADVLAANETLHLAIVPLSTNGADYYDAGSASPPTIAATLAP